MSRSFGHFLASSAFPWLAGLLVVAITYFGFYANHSFGEGKEFPDFMVGRVMPLYILVYFLSVVLLPTQVGVTGSSCSGDTVLWEAHTAMAVVLYAGIVLDFVFASKSGADQLPQIMRGDNEKGALARIMSLCNSKLFHLGVGLVTKLDTYTDVCFAVIAFQCGSALWIPSVVLLSIAVFLTQCGPSSFMAVLALFDDDNNDLLDDDGNNLVFKLAEFALTAETLRQGERDPGDIFYHAPAIGRFLLEDVGQVVIQIMFLSQTASVNTTVLLSISVGISISFYSAVKAINVVCCRSPKKKEPQEEAVQEVPNPGRTPEASTLVELADNAMTRV